MKCSHNSLIWLCGLACLLCMSQVSAGTVYDWDNYSGDCKWETALNWNPVSVPGVGDTATFFRPLANTVVTVQHGREILDMRVIDTATVDLTIGDGTRNSRFDLDLNPGNSLVVGDSFGDTATFNLRGGWLDTFGVQVGGRAIVNVGGAGAYWDSTDVVISGDTTANAAGVGLGLGAEILTRGLLDIGGEVGSGRVVVDGIPAVPFGPTALWTVLRSVDVGPTGTSGFNYGQLELRNGGRMTVRDDFSVHGQATSTATVRTGGQLEVADLLEIGSYGRLELQDANSKIKTGRFSKTGTGGVFDWTAGTLEISNEPFRLDTIATNSAFGSSLTVGAEKRLIISLPDPNNSLEVGYLGNGSLAIEAGGDVESYRGTAGVFGTSNGAVTVRNPGSSWTISEQLRVGHADFAGGQLNILHGASVSSSAVFVGMFDDARGDVIVDGPNSSLTTTGPLSVADSGRAQGSLTIRNQGTVSSQAGFINGRFGNSLGTGGVTVDGMNCRWMISQDLVVGNDAGGSGTLLVRNGGAVSVGNYVNINRFGEVRLEFADLVAHSIDVRGGGTLSGVGTINVSPVGGVFNGGLVQVGGSFGGSTYIGELFIEGGNYVQLASGSLEIGTDGYSYDRLTNPSGSVALAGTLQLGPWGTPNYFDEFWIMSWQSRTGHFDAILGNMLSADRWLAPIYDPNGLKLVTALPGDANLDGVVDGADFIIWNSHKFTAAPYWQQGDFNSDGFVDGSDFIIWNAHKFTSVTSLVPEPCGLATWCWLLALVRPLCRCGGHSRFA